ncbi:MAG: flavodoxin family protein [Armatimonadota bacterium]
MSDQRPTAAILIGSPRKGGNTDLLAGAFLEGLRAVGGEGEKIFVDDLNIRPIGPVVDDMTVRVDVHGDDDFMPTLERVLIADILVFGSPVYWQGLPAQLKAFVDRWSCYYTNPLLLDGMRGKVFAALVPHGAPDPDHHEWVTRPMRVWAEHFEARWAGHVSAVAQRKGLVADMPEVLRAARELGRHCGEIAGRSTKG